MARYVQIDKRAPIKSGGDKLRRFLTRTFRGELFVGLWVVLKNMFKRGGSHTLRYPMEKFVMPPRYRGVHKLMHLLESGSERCIGCGLCEKICVANCIAMETSLGSDGRKKVDNYSINLGRCVYCGLCADVCPEIAIVHGCEYELASEQRAYYGFKEDLLIRGENLCLNGAAQEFAGYGSLDENAGARIKVTPNAYIKSDAANDEPNLKSANSNLKNSAAESSKKEGAASDKILFSGADLSGKILSERQDVGRVNLKKSSAVDAEKSKENSVTDAQKSAPDSQRNSKENPTSQSAEDSATDSKNLAENSKESSVVSHAENSVGDSTENFKNNSATNDDSSENSKENSVPQGAENSATRGKKSKVNSKKNSAADAENSTLDSARNSKENSASQSAEDSAAQGEEQ
ncbi:NADH-quinone oxidoreductase subunit NuoI [Campylobacter sp.]|uniref:NADH-quinone oxidoreductase subunit NuoI n=1 Tax=Campylobacter sp. TaxID=205 RepID=UPI0027B8822D|nr:NADH-quinone oxidoreductase subunit NuoI [Campylobacter sp.]